MLPSSLATIFVRRLEIAIIDKLSIVRPNINITVKVKVLCVLYGVK